MKRTAQSRPSKASLAARGLATKPIKGKRTVKGKKVPDAKPGYCLYSTDSEDQASSVGRGLDRCAALLTNILDTNSEEYKDKKGAEKKAFVRERVKSIPSVKRQATSSSVGKPIVIPTASHKDQGPSTLYNERLVASTPVLNPGERKKQQQLLEREQELTRQIHQLQQHYELLQRQKSPEVQEEQKRSLQESMMHELDDYHNQSKEDEERLSKGTPTSRRSLDYQTRTHQSYQSPEHDEIQTSPLTALRTSLQHARPVSDHSNNGGIKKQVRVVSPHSSERYHPKADSSNASPRRSGASSVTGDSYSPNAANNEVRTLQYLTKELREVIGNHGDLEVNRLLMEIDQTCSLLPYLIPASSPYSNDDGLGNKRVRMKNEYLKRKLQDATEKSEHLTVALQNYQQLQRGQASVTFDLASCKSENASLQKQLKEEKQENEKLHKELRNLEKVIEDLREEKRKFLQILENKEQNYSKSRRSSQLESLKLSNDIKQLKAELEASKLSLEATKKESVIVNLSLKQKDAEIERLNELTKALNQTMRRALGEIHDYTPNRNNGSITQPTPPDNNYTSSVPLQTEPRVIPNLHPPRTSITDSDIKGFETLQDYRLSSLYETTIRKSPILNTTTPRTTTSHFSTRKRSPTISNEDSVCFSPKASLGLGAWDEGEFVRDRSLELSTSSSPDEEDFQRDLANLDADIARIQRSLRETARRS